MQTLLFLLFIPLVILAIIGASILSRRRHALTSRRVAPADLLRYLTYLEASNSFHAVAELPKPHSIKDPEDVYVLRKYWKQPGSVYVKMGNLFLHLYPFVHSRWKKGYQQRCMRLKKNGLLAWEVMFLDDQVYFTLLGGAFGKEFSRRQLEPSDLQALDEIYRRLKQLAEETNPLDAARLP